MVPEVSTPLQTILIVSVACEPSPHERWEAITRRDAGETLSDIASVIGGAAGYQAPPDHLESLDANRSLSHANRVSGRAFTAHRETDFGRPETKGPNSLPDGLRFPQRPRTGHCTRRKPRKIEGVTRRRGTRG